MIKLKNSMNSILKGLLIPINIIIIVIDIILCANYVTNISIEQENDAKDSFSMMVKVKSEVAQRFMTRQQEFCNNWATYIDKENYTIDQSIEFVRKINSNNNESMVHFLEYDTMSGISSIADEDGNYNVKYNDEQKAAFEEIIKKFENYKEVKEILYSSERNIYNTRTYINPTNGEQSVGFCKPIILKDNDGHKKNLIIVRVVPVRILQEMWVFPSAYNNAEMALIEENGNIMIESKTLKGQNLIDLLNKDNVNINKESFNSYLGQFNENKINILELKNADGENAFYVCVQLSNNEDTYFVGYTTENYMINKTTDWQMVLYVVIGFLMILVIDGGAILIANRQLANSIKRMKESQDANMAKSRFLSSMSHDIRTPMNAIIGMSAIAVKNIDNSEKVKDCLDKIGLAGNHLLTLINDILDISKVESGRMTLNPIVFSLSDSITNLTNIVRSQVKEKDLKLELRVHGLENEYIFADELRLNQIFINLLTNAVKYTHVKGKITVDIEERPIPEDSKFMELIFSVKDTGIGMSEEFMEHMYDSFAREKDSRVDTIQGSGLGLAITKQMVDLMEGTIDCESKQGVGTKFTVKLKLAIAERMTDEFMLPPMNMLLVDDDEIFLESAEDTLSSMGVKVDLATGGRKAIDMVVEHHKRNNDYPVIIIDWKMPDMDGVETTRNIRKEVGNDVPIIIISAYDWSEIEDDAIKAGANGFISKPLFKSTIYNKMNEFFHFDEKSKNNTQDNGEDLAKMNLLIAEDNDLNWEIIQELLITAGIKAERAKNGKECVEILQKEKAGKYDAILMDIQMPVMNGYEATEAIRNLEDEKKKNIPIIAMTADAFTEDIKRCIDTGMNAHVAKPVDVKKLFVELRKVKKS